MTLSETCIRRPVLTTLMTASLIVFGIFAYRLLPVAALPAVDFPTIQITATLPGASPETMAASVASPIERQLSTISGISSMTSSSSLGTTQITIQFDLNRNIDSVENDKVATWYNDARAIVLAIQRQPDANTVAVVDEVRTALPAMRAQIPPAIEMTPLFDRSISIRDAVRDVQETLGIAVCL